MTKFSPAASNANSQRRPNAAERRALDATVHRVLSLGLMASAALLAAGLGLSLLTGQALPTRVAPPEALLHAALGLQPAGLIGAGLVLLIATPCLRVALSVGVFLAERDWRYAGVTALVLAFLAAAVVLGAAG